MTDTRKKLGWPFWTTITLLVVVAYPLSVGPVWWILGQRDWPEWMNTFEQVFYWPLGWLMGNSPLLTEWMLWYMRLWIPVVIADSNFLDAPP